MIQEAQESGEMYPTPGRQTRIVEELHLHFVDDKKHLYPLRMGPTLTWEDVLAYCSDEQALESFQRYII